VGFLVDPDSKKLFEALRKPSHVHKGAYLVPVHVAEDPGIEATRPPQIVLARAL
jgi:hypothetical protein